MVFFFLLALVREHGRSITIITQIYEIKMGRIYQNFIQLTAVF